MCRPPLPRRVRAALLLVALAPALSGCVAAPGVVSALRPQVLSGRLMAPGSGVGHVGLLVEPDDGVRRLTRAIRAADVSIWLVMYLLTNRTIIHDLEYAHGYGVDVRVILEPHPYGMPGDPNRYAFNNLMAADIPVRWASARYLLTHEKSMVIDGRTAYIMTSNFTRAAFRSNREFDVVDRDPRDVTTLRNLFEADWAGRAFASRDRNLLLSPVDARPLLVALLRSARRSLDVYAEELQDGQVVRELVAAARRGVRVRVILPAAVGTDFDAAAVRTTSAVGVRVRRLPRSYLYVHAKAIVVDGRRAFVGSQNLSIASLDRNRELGVVVADPKAVRRIEGAFARDWRR